MKSIGCNIEQCYCNRDGRCIREPNMFYCPIGRRDDVKVTYDNGMGISHDGSDVTISRISISVKGRYGEMLSDLKNTSGKLYHVLLENVLKAGIDKLWFDLNARRGEI